MAVYWYCEKCKSKVPAGAVKWVKAAGGYFHTRRGEHPVKKIVTEEAK